MSHLFLCKRTYEVSNAHKQSIRNTGIKSHYFQRILFLSFFSISPIPSRTLVMSYIRLFCTCKTSSACICLAKERHARNKIPTRRYQPLEFPQRYLDQLCHQVHLLASSGTSLSRALKGNNEKERKSEIKISWKCNCPKQENQ